jgi:hypothetical protein
MSTKRLVYAIGLVGLIVVVALGFAALIASPSAGHANAQNSDAPALQSAPDKPLPQDVAISAYGDDTFFKLADPQAGVARNGSVSSTARHGVVSTTGRGRGG